MFLSSLFGKKPLEAMAPRSTFVQARVITASDVEFDRVMALVFLNGGSYTRPMREEGVGQMLGKKNGCEFLIPVIDYCPAIKHAAYLTFPNQGALLGAKVEIEKAGLRCLWGCVEEIVLWSDGKTERNLI